MESTWQVFALCIVFFLELPLSAQPVQESATSASVENGVMASATSMRGAMPSASASIRGTNSGSRGAPTRQGFRPLSVPPKEASSFGPDAVSRKLYGLPVRDPSNPDKFDCKTESCGIHDKFYELTDSRVDFVQPEYQCSGALPAALNSFRNVAVEQCSRYAIERSTWKGCRAEYCDMYEKVVKAVTNGTEYFLGGDCEDLLSFNKSICLSYYRDSSAWCECICPAIPLLESTDACKEEILAYLLIGRRGGLLLKRFRITPICSSFFCKWIEKLADPRRPQEQGAPSACFNFQLPFQRSQCTNLMNQITVQSTDPSLEYNPCPWDTANSKDFMMECTDGTICDVRVDSWACCQRHANRARCPANFPEMCADPLECVGESDHCCVAAVVPPSGVPDPRDPASNCASGRRQCSPLMMPNMPEWDGFVPPGVPAYIGPTTTMSLFEYNLWLGRQPIPTTQPESWGEDAMPYLMFFVIPVAVLVLCSALCACLWFGSETWRKFTSDTYGAARLMILYNGDIVHLFRPGEKEREWPDLPPKISDADRARMEADQDACQALEDACKFAFAYGRIHLVSVHFAKGRGPQKEARDILSAVALVRSRNLQEVGENPRLIEEGLKWCDTLFIETQIVEALERAFPSLTIDFRNLTTAPVVGAPWKGTPVGHAVDCEERRKVWATVEELSAAIKVAEDGGASTGLTESAHELMNELVARTPELPADRCVLDPEGKGVKLLPKGRQRGLWTHTGDMYLYQPDTQTAGELNDFELPPGEELMGTSVADARPVCASWAKSNTCKLGKRCPWRHCKPKQGDSVREPIFHS